MILVDTIGELSAVWGLADVAFVGGSLLPGRGGQNMMEPAALRCLGPVRAVHGQLPRDRRATARAGRSPRGRRRRASLTAALLEDLDDPEAAAARGAAGRAFVLAQNGAADRTLAELDRLVEAAPAKST